ncbi:MAG: hypothetical protein OYK82_05270 [Gammaproteobacteria bacterium]|nr:hypothetical protein [Gammaproteobacteria bacterium]
MTLILIVLVMILLVLLFGAAAVKSGCAVVLVYAVGAVVSFFVLFGISMLPNDLQLLAWGLLVAGSGAWWLYDKYGSR